MAKLAPSWLKLGPSWTQVGSKLAQVAPKIGSRRLLEALLKGLGMVQGGSWETAGAKRCSRRPQGGTNDLQELQHDPKLIPKGFKFDPKSIKNMTYSSLVWSSLEPLLLPLVFMKRASHSISYRFMLSLVRPPSCLKLVYVASMLGQVGLMLASCCST